jgi:hypothetical protein
MIGYIWTGLVHSESNRGPKFEKMCLQEVSETHNWRPILDMGAKLSETSSLSHYCPKRVQTILDLMQSCINHSWSHSISVNFKMFQAMCRRKFSINF